MTLPFERTNAIINLGNEVAQLVPYASRKAGNVKQVRVPLALLQSLLMRLRHYPTLFDLEELAKARPDILGRP